MKFSIPVYSFKYFVMKKWVNYILNHYKYKRELNVEKINVNLSYQYL